MTLLIMESSALVVTFLVSAILCRWIIRQKQEAWLDKPNERSLHTIPVPRLGGAAIWGGAAIGAIIAWPLLNNILSFYCVTAAILLLLVALIDDRTALPPAVRLLAQFMAALMAVFGAGLYVSWGAVVWLWPWIGILVVLWGINLYNFMDGMDGFAGAMAAIGFATLAVLGFLQGNISFSYLNGILVAASAGFLCFNFPPARIFMGDSGSTVIGFLMVAVSIIGWKEGLYPFWSPLVIFSPFWVDATATLIKRLCKGERVWLPHRQHFYQRLVLAGYSHRQVTMSYGFIMLLCSLSAITWQSYSEVYNEATTPLIWTLFYSLVLVCGNNLIKNQQPAGDRESK